MKITVQGFNLGLIGNVAVWGGFFGLYVTITMLGLAKYPPATTEGAIEAAGKNFETFPGNWASSITPNATNEYGQPAVEFESVESFSNYLATVHLYEYQWSTNLVDWFVWNQVANDEAQTENILAELNAASLRVKNHLGTNAPEAMFWRVMRTDCD